MVEFFLPKAARRNSIPTTQGKPYDNEHGRPLSMLRDWQLVDIRKRSFTGSSRESDLPIVCAGQRTDRGGSSPSGARMRGAISKSGGNASLAGNETEGQGVHREVESEGLAENCRAVVEGAVPKTNRSAKGGARSSLHYGGEGTAGKISV
jgi:hypothetical protein